MYQKHLAPNPNTAHEFDTKDNSHSSTDKIIHLMLQFGMISEKSEIDPKVLMEVIDQDKDGVFSEHDFLRSFKE